MPNKIITKELKYSAHNYMPLPVVLVRGQGSFLWDDKGKKYIDMMSAYSAVSHGHCHHRIIDALAKQSQTLCVTSRAFHSDKLAPFMEKLCHLSGMDMGIPMNSGAEAVETAIKAARMWGYKVKRIAKNKAKVIVAQNNFHGRTTTLISFSSEPAYKKNFGPLTPGFKTIPYGDAKALEEAIDEDTCAFLVEPMQGEGGIIIPPDGWLKKVQRICKKHNVLFILDEIQTGLGRSGKMFAFEHEITKPDGLILGKALGGGVLPVSAFLGKKEIMNLFKPGSHGSTFGGNPLACTVAMEALDTLKDENLVENSRRLGEYLLERLQKIDSKLIKDVRGRGLFVGLEINKEYASARHVCERLLQNGVLTKDTHETVIRLAPPLVITENILDDALVIIVNTLKEVEAGLY